MWIKTTVACHYGRGHIRKTNNTECWQAEEQTELSYIASGNVISMTTFQNYLAIANNVQHTLTIWPNTFITVNVPKGSKCGFHKNIFTGMFLVALFVTAQAWKPPKCYLIGYNVIMFSRYILSNIAV